MTPKRLFSKMPPDAALFYYRILNRVILNSYAVQYGLFDTLFCETEDPEVMLRWVEALPSILEQIEKRFKKD